MGRCVETEVLSTEPFLMPSMKVTARDRHAAADQTEGGSAGGWFSRCLPQACVQFKAVNQTNLGQFDIPDRKACRRKRKGAAVIMPGRME